jgi:hypothetical protein
MANCYSNPQQVVKNQKAQKKAAKNHSQMFWLYFSLFPIPYYCLLPIAFCLKAANFWARLK